MAIFPLTDRLLADGTELKHMLAKTTPRFGLPDMQFQVGCYCLAGVVVLTAGQITAVLGSN